MSLLVIGLLALPSASNGQRDSAPAAAARLAGKVSSSINGKPVSGVMIAVRGSQRFQVTDSTGLFDLDGLPPGEHVLAVRFEDRTSEDYGVALQPGKTLRVIVLLDIEAVDLNAVVVEVAAADAGLSVVGFYQRRDRGIGRFITREDIVHRNPHDLSTLFAGTGVRFSCRRGICVPTRPGGGTRCQLAVLLDGLWVRDFDLNWIPPQDVQAIEVYRQSETPVEFARFAMDCGAVVVWTRRR